MLLNRRQSVDPFVVGEGLIFGRDETVHLLGAVVLQSHREITDALNEDEPIAHSTVQTLLRQLEAKGAVDHEQDGRTFYFFPLVKQDKVKKSAARELIQNVFEGSVGGLVSYLLENEKVSAVELAEIRKLIDKKRKK